MKKGFTVLEMILVLTVISMVVLITIPNIVQKKKAINRVGCEALVEVVNSQILLYELENGEKPGTVDELVAEGYLKESQCVCPDGRRIEIVDGEAGY